MDDCIFCKIVKKEIPASVVYQDRNFLAFLDINPVSDGHLLVIPKNHIIWMQDADDKTISGIFKLTKRLMKAMKNGLNCDYVLVSIVGKDIPHFHVHLIARHFNDNLQQFPTKKYKDGEENEVIKKITGELKNTNL